MPSPPTISQQLKNLYQDIAAGGIIISTPPTDPILRTILQFDGDMVTFIAPDAAQRHNYNTTDLNNTLQTHTTALSQRVATFGNLGNITTMTKRLISGASAATLTATASIDLIHLTLNWYSLAAFAPAALRLALPRAAGPLFRFAFSEFLTNFSRDRHNTNMDASQHLRNKVASRQTS